MTQFADLELNPKVLKAIEEAGYTAPTPIQEGAIPPALAGRDVLGIAQTGTGKTASFTLPMITRLARGRARARMPRSLVLAPTRELAAQVAENFDTYSKYVKLTKALLIGGVSFKEQDVLIDKGVDVLIATPGRLLDHFERGKLLLTGIEIMVVDEADRMLDMGFIPDIERIFSLTPFTRQTLFFSATMAPEIERITNTFLSAPEKIEVARQATASLTITQALYSFAPSRRDRAAAEKRQMLREIIAAEGEACRNAIIFCNRKVDVDVVAKAMKKAGLNAEPIHGDLDQSQRTRTLDGFRDGSIRFLVASDVAARGLDIPNVSHVFNYDVPSHAEDYIHRIGRTGRAGREGRAFTIAVPSDDKYIDAIERLVETALPRATPPWTPKGGGAANSEGAAGPAEEGKPPRKARSRRKKSAPAEPAEGQAPETSIEEAPGPGPQLQGEEAPATRPEPDPDADADTDADARNQAPRRSRGRGSAKTRGGTAGGGDRPVGLGDHVPTFIALSFYARRGGPARAPEEAVDAADEDVAVLDRPADDGGGDYGEAETGT